MKLWRPTPGGRRSYVGGAQQLRPAWVVTAETGAGEDAGVRSGIGDGREEDKETGTSAPGAET